jgi:hypothetical protein
MRSIPPAPALALPCVLLLVALAALGEWWGPAAPPDLASWDVPRLVEFLHGHGLPLRAISSSRDGGVSESAYLTTTSKGWGELAGLRRGSDQIDLWQGTLFCERASLSVFGAQIQMWGDCCLVVGPFVFFGDRDLLARVRAAFAN